MLRSGANGAKGQPRGTCQTAKGRGSRNGAPKHYILCSEHSVSADGPTVARQWPGRSLGGRTGVAGEK